MNIVCIFLMYIPRLCVQSFPGVFGLLMVTKFSSLILNNNNNSEGLQIGWQWHAMSYDMSNGACSRTPQNEGLISQVILSKYSRHRIHPETFTIHTTKFLMPRSIRAAALCSDIFALHSSENNKKKYKNTPLLGVAFYILFLTTKYNMAELMWLPNIDSLVGILRFEKKISI